MECVRWDRLTIGLNRPLQSARLIGTVETGNCTDTDVLGIKQTIKLTGQTKIKNIKMY